jgi:putative PIN family toxin of toxin-antitoxin system
MVTFAELATRLWKPKFDRYINIGTRNALLRDARAAALWVDIPAELENQHWSRDPSDDAFVRAALAARATWLITGDDDLLSLPPIEWLTILTPAKALTLPAFA